jgi:hypothetical protein
VRLISQLLQGFALNAPRSLTACGAVLLKPQRCSKLDRVAMLTRSGQRRIEPNA